MKSTETSETNGFNVDELAAEIRKADGNHDLGAAALAEALMPYVDRMVEAERQRCAGIAKGAMDWKSISSTWENGYARAQAEIERMILGMPRKL